MSIKSFFLVSKILFQQQFIWWLLISLVAIPLSVMAYGKDGADFTVLVSVVAFLSMVSISCVHIVRSFPLQPEIGRYVLLVAMFWSILFSALFWQIVIVGGLLKLDPMTFFLPAFIPLMLIKTTKSAKISMSLMIFVWLMRAFVLATLHAFLYKYVGDSFIYVAVMLSLYLLVIYWRVQPLRYNDMTLRKG